MIGSVAFSAAISRLDTGADLAGSVIETKGEKLWTPQDSEPQSHKKYLEDRFGESIAFVNVTVDDKAQPAQGNVLTASHIRDAFASYTAMLSVKLADGQVRVYLLTLNPRVAQHFPHPTTV